ncbi:hypothetical protein L1276_000172 [Flavobacterium sp. HSC-32F16]|uniref:hypothetical protein n=1 Tax=Flavobacterium sp. HSC-32F16 TaxID=2910964 RepID=UPI0020A28E3F|nr:hypothetical protein [Flavobacterium sp. HSC-32F16]MCP2025032.1 hypothetical protein [Flavobacterium sp. HSC-32F16]
MKMKKQTEILKFVNSKLLFLGIFALVNMWIFHSCTTEDASNNSSGQSEKNVKIDNSNSNNTNRLGENGPGGIDGNVSSFSNKIFFNSGRLESELNKNLYVGFNEETMNMLNAAQNENDLKIVFERAGIANSQEIIDILKSNVEAQQAFISENPDFYNLTVEEQSVLLNFSAEESKKKYANNVTLLDPNNYLVPDCAHAFNTSISRCAGDFGTCAVFAVAGAYAGLAPGLLAAAYCMVTKITCDNRAKRDFKDCGAKEIGTPDIDGVLTLHCDLDSCWTTDRRGVFVRRIR